MKPSSSKRRRVLASPECIQPNKAISCQSERPQSCEDDDDGTVLNIPTTVKMPVVLMTSDTLFQMYGANPYPVAVTGRITPRNLDSKF